MNGLGIVIYALGIHQRNQWGGRHAGLAAPLAFLEEAHALGAAGIQYPLTLEDAPQVAELRRRAEAYSMHFEASIEPPKPAGDLDRFEKLLRLAKEAGAVVARTVIMPGRRYEEFHTLDEFRAAVARGRESLERAEPIARRHGVRLAVENHKDQRMPERVELLRHLGSEFIGACVDVGNNLALLEDPMDVAKALAPWALTVHLKDQDLAADPEGFLLADAALGRGCLDLPGVVRLLREARPEVTFNLEVITRDALKVPVFTPAYWATLGDVPARDLAAILRRVKERSATPAFPQVSRLRVQDQLALERETVQQSLRYASEKL